MGFVDKARGLQKYKDNFLKYGGSRTTFFRPGSKEFFFLGLPKVAPSLSYEETPPQKPTLDGDACFSVLPPSKLQLVPNTDIGGVL